MKLIPVCLVIQGLTVTAHLPTVDLFQQSLYLSKHRKAALSAMGICFVNSPLKAQQKGECLALIYQS